MKIIYFVFLILIIGCGNNINVPKKVTTENEVEGEIDGNIDVNHNINLDLSTFREVCEAEFAEEENEQVKEVLVADCQQERLNEFLDLLTNLANTQDQQNEEN